MRVLWLANALREGGVPVVEHIGWRTRGWEPWAPQFGIVHATAAPRTQSDEVQVRIVRDGHATLAGPIANACVDRSGRWHVLASGRCNTALTGWAGPAAGLGNTNLLGVEACNDNRTEPWPDVQYQAYARGWAAICRQLGWPAGRLVGHKEHQPGDKSDPTFAMDRFRSRVAQLLAEGDDMALSDQDLDRIAVAVWGRTNPATGREYHELVRGLVPVESPVTGDKSTWQAQTKWAHLRARQGLDATLGQVVPRLDALLSAVQGGDAAAVLARLDELSQLAAADRRAHADQLEAQLEAAAAERAQLLELVQKVAAGEADAAAVVDELGRRLALSPEPA
jgi:hypothetical protein